MATIAAAVSIVVSIAAFNILLGLSLALLLISRDRWRMPPILLPLILFLSGTLISLSASGDPAHGFPQVKKFWVFLTLPLVYTALRRVREDVYPLLLGWAAAASAAALWSGVQFARRLHEAHALSRDFYRYYIAQRTTGFTGHWMTFGGTQMIVLMLLVAWLLFAPRRRRITMALAVAACLLVISLVLSLDRGVWIACVVAGCYLIGCWRPKLLWAVPAVLAIVFVAAPGVLKDRIVSIYHPHGETDSNSHRYYTMRTGIAMIEAHPWLGLGPEQIGPQFDAYLPPDLSRQKPEGFYGHLHNIYLQYAAERGIPTLLCLLWFIGAAFVDFRKALRTATGQSRALLLGATAVIIAVLVEGFGEHNLGDSEVLVCFLVTLAIGYIARDNSNREEASAKPAPAALTDATSLQS